MSQQTQQPGGGQGQLAGLDDGLVLFLLFVFAIVIVSVGMWHFFHAEIVTVINWIRLVELSVLQFIDPRFEQTIEVILISDPANFQWHHMVKLANLTGHYLRWPAALFCLGMAYYLYSVVPDMKYNRNLDLEALIGEQAKVWPAILPITVENPANDRSGRWAPAMAPVEWLEQCEKREKQAGRSLDLALDANIDEGEEPFNRATIAAYLSGQLLIPWEGSGSPRLPMHLKGIMAAMALKGSPHLSAKLRGQKSNDLLDCMNRVWVKHGYRCELPLEWLNKDAIGKPIQPSLKEMKDPFSGATFWHCDMDKALAEADPETLWRDRGKRGGKVWTGEANCKTVGEVIEQVLREHNWVDQAAERHAYVETAIITVYENAKKIGGVMQSASLLWLRPYNRHMWYVINSSGRRVPFVEVAGVFAHWQAEKQREAPMDEPVVGEAVKGMLEAVLEVQHGN